jgi:glycosyltransferase involved in cell wall biosynthesis
VTTGRVLQLLGPSTGGIRRHVAYLTDQLRTTGWEVGVAGPAGVLDDLDHIVPVPSGSDPRALLRARRALLHLMPSYDVVHAHGLKAGWLATLPGPRSRSGWPPVVLSVHNLVLDDVAGRSAGLLRWLEGRLPARVDATIAISDEVARRFAGSAGAAQIRVIPPAGPLPNPTRTPLEVRTDLGLDPSDDLVVTAARLSPQKGLDVLLDAAEAAAAQRPRLRWFVFGEGALRPALDAEIARRGLADVVHLAGSRPSVDDELAAADVVAVTSQWESGPLVVLEALALGRPVVSTRVGLAPDVIDPGRGRVVDVGAAGDLADAVVALLRDPPDASGGMSGSFARFRPAALASEVEGVYREVWRAP